MTNEEKDIATYRAYKAGKDAGEYIGFNRGLKVGLFFAFISTILMLIML